MSKEAFLDDFSIKNFLLSFSLTPCYSPLEMLSGRRVYLVQGFLGGEEDSKKWTFFALIPENGYKIESESSTTLCHVFSAKEESGSFFWPKCSM